MYKGLPAIAMMIATVTLAGCQLTPGQKKIEAIAQQQMERNAHTKVVLSDHIDLYLSQEGRHAFLADIIEALEQTSSEMIFGEDPNTQGEWRVLSMEPEWQAIEVKRPIDESINVDHNFAFMDVPYRSKTKLNVRAEPSLDAERVDIFAKGDVFNAMAKVDGEPWLLVEQQGYIKGYVHADYVVSNVDSRDILSTFPNPLLSPHTDAQVSEIDDAQSQQGFFGIYTCRRLTYQLSIADDVSEGQFKACRKQEGIWYIDPFALPMPQDDDIEQEA